MSALPIGAYACQIDDLSVSVSPTHNYVNDLRTIAIRMAKLPCW